MFRATTGAPASVSAQAQRVVAQRRAAYRAAIGAPPGRAARLAVWRPLRPDSRGAQPAYHAPPATRVARRRAIAARHHLRARPSPARADVRAGDAHRRWARANARRLPGAPGQAGARWLPRARRGAAIRGAPAPSAP